MIAVPWTRNDFVCLRAYIYSSGRMLLLTIDIYKRYKNAIRQQATGNSKYELTNQSLEFCLDWLGTWRSKVIWIFPFSFPPSSNIVKQSLVNLPSVLKNGHIHFYPVGWQQVPTSYTNECRKPWYLHYSPTHLKAQVPSFASTGIRK